MNVSRIDLSSSLDVTAKYFQRNFPFYKQNQRTIALHREIVMMNTDAVQLAIRREFHVNGHDNNHNNNDNVPDGNPLSVANGTNVGKRPKTSFIQYRYVLIALGFLGLLNVYAMRVNLNVAIVSMVNHTAVHIETKPSDCIVATESEVVVTSSPELSISSINWINSTIVSSTRRKITKKDGPFAWDPVVQGLILGAFYWGYVVTPIPGGALAETFGAKWLFAGGTLVTAILGMFIPIVTSHFGHVGLIVLRVLQGLGEGVTYPAIETQIAHWMPKNQRTTAVSLIHVGGFFGVVVGMFISGELAASSWGWPSIFYVFGTITILWFFLWIALTSNKPEEHFLISQRELDLILNDFGHQKPTHGAAIPWRKILLSPAAWACHISLFGTLWLQFSLVTLLPTFLGTVFDFDIKSNGFYSALPYIGAIVAGAIAGPLADLIRRKQWLSSTSIRKLFNGIALVIPSLIICSIVPVAGCDGLLSLMLFVAAGAVRGISEAGCYAIPIDMSPDFAGAIFGISVSIGSFSGILVPYITGKFTETENSTTNWAYSFDVTAAVGIVSAVFFQIFANAEVQPWGVANDMNRYDNHEKEEFHVDVKRKQARSIH